MNPNRWLRNIMFCNNRIVREWKHTKRNIFTMQYCRSVVSSKPYIRLFLGFYSSKALDFWTVYSEPALTAPYVMLRPARKSIILTNSFQTSSDNLPFHNWITNLRL